MKTIRSIRLRLLALAAAALSLAASARADVTTSGATSFQTGTPTATLSFTSAISIPITTSGYVYYLGFDEWITPASSTRVIVYAAPTMQTVSFTLNGTSGSTTLNFLNEDHVTSGAFTSNDGYLSFNTPISVSAGQTLVFQPASFTFTAKSTSDANLPTDFSGAVYVVDNSSQSLSGPASAGPVPEPSTWSLLDVGVAGLGIAALRQRRAAAARA